MEYDFNTSALVRDALPDVIERPNGRENITIRIRKFQRDTRDTYEDVRRVSHDIWGGSAALFSDAKTDDSRIDIDFIVHFGMIALGWDPNQFRFETVARRDGYSLPGDDGKLVDSAELEKLGLPATLTTCLDVEGAWRQVQAKFPNVKTSVSDDAGLYFCEFRLYSSLAEAILTKEFHSKKGHTTFLHLPQAHDPDAIGQARDIAVAYIAGLVDGFVSRKGEVKG